jgi:hypothetical protein
VANGIELDIAEIQSLRQEITARIGLMNAVVALELAAAGTGFGLLDRWTHVLAALAAISSFLWLLWIDQSLSTYKIAAYLAIDVVPRMREYASRPLLNWEYFLRSVEAGGARSARALYRGQAPRHAGIVRNMRADLYMPLLFGATPPILLTLYVLAGVRNDVEWSTIAIGTAFGALMWIFTLTRFFDFLHNTRILDAAIRAAEVNQLIDVRVIRRSRETPRAAP